MGRQSYGDELRNMADRIDAMEESYDNLSSEADDTYAELEKANDKLRELEAYLTWAESYYPDMLKQYQALMKLGE